MEYIVSILLILGVVLYALNREPPAVPPRKVSKAAHQVQLMKVLLDLNEESLDELLRLYEQHFGTGAARYARETHRKWKVGKVRPNKQTFRRFLLHLPTVMSFDLKCEVLRELREEYCARNSYELSVDTADWKDNLTPLVERVIAEANKAELPNDLRKRLHWLAEDDMQLAGAILAQSEVRQTRAALSLLENEFSNIELLLNNVRGKRNITHILRLPQATITLKIQNRQERS